MPIITTDEFEKQLCDAARHRIAIARIKSESIRNKLLADRLANAGLDPQSYRAAILDSIRIVLLAKWKEFSAIGMSGELALQGLREEIEGTISDDQTMVGGDWPYTN